ncbi:MAG: hypothetical protein H6Q21_874 [Bacteroidetes bacterium]|nr:hypothetical protein [Bacteroidota bacterium]
MFRGILPKEIAFYDYFDQLIEIDLKASNLIHEMIEKGENLVDLARQIKELGITLLSPPLTATIFSPL